MTNQQYAHVNITLILLDMLSLASFLAHDDVMTQTEV